MCITSLKVRSPSKVFDSQEALFPITVVLTATVNSNYGLCMTDSYPSFAEFSPAETMAITGVSPERQRVLRHQKLFDQGSPYSISDLGFFLVVETLAKRGLSLAAASAIGNHCNVRIANFAIDTWGEANGEGPLNLAKDEPRFLMFSLPDSGRPRAFDPTTLIDRVPPEDDDHNVVPAHIVLDLECLGRRIATETMKPLVLDDEVGDDA